MIAAAVVIIAAFAAGLFYLKRTSDKSLPPALPAESVIRIDEFDIFYQDSGKGQALLFLHGIGASSFCWRYQLDEFSKTHRVIAPDLPGFGRSSKLTSASYTLETQTQRLVQFIEKLELTNFVIVGSSMGGLLGISLAHRLSHKVTGLILLAPAVEPKIIPAGLSRIGWTSSFLMPIVTQGLIERIMRRVNTNTEIISPEVVSRYYEPYTQKDAVVTFIKSLKTLRDRSIKRLIRDLNVPTLTLYGAKDSMVPLWVMRRLDQKLKNNVLKIHPEAGHHLQEDDHLWTNQQIHEFLSSKLK